MMHHPTTRIQLPDGNGGSLPLLDEEFDPDLEDVIHDNEMLSLYFRHSETDEFIV